MLRYRDYRLAASEKTRSNAGFRFLNSSFLDETTACALLLAHHMEELTTSKSFDEKKVKARAKYDAQSSIRNPYFNQAINLTAQGFHHLQFSAHRERDKKEQLLKFNLLPLAFEVIRKAGTVQE